MINPSRFYAVAVLFVGLTPSSLKLPPENHVPIVKIIAPANHAVIAAGTPVSYQIGVSDQEDGDSRFDEINIKEVLLEVEYMKSKPAAARLINSRVADDPPGLANISLSNCFNCHQFNSKSIGPSFFEISRRYPLTKANEDTLTRRVKNGSAGIWGREKMPSHPELTEEQVKATITWILKNSARPDIRYYNGTSGILSFPGNRKGTYVLTASYTDHGLKDQPVRHLKGADRLMVTVR